MSKEAMKLALEKIADALPAYIDGVASREYLATIHKALANEALDKKAENARELGLDYEPAQQEQEQEPVAWMFQHEETGRTMCVDAQQVEWGFEKGNRL